MAPDAELLPPEVMRADDPLLPYMRTVFAATRDLVCAYIFDFPSYLAMGGAGAVALERSIALAAGSHLTVIDGSFATDAHAALLDDASFGADAITVLLQVTLDAFQARQDRGVFVVTDDPAASWRFVPSRGELVAGRSVLRLLPADILRRARSLDFEHTLRNLVESYVRP